MSLVTGLPKRMLPMLTIAFLAITAGAVNAESIGGPGGDWPASWPEELEPLRKQAWTWQHGLVASTSYEIPFNDRELFESMWPHILSVKSKGGSLTLSRGPHVLVKSNKTAGVRIFPPIDPTATGPKSLTRIELVVDGKVVDLNRIRLPPHTQIIDRRFKGQTADKNPAG